MRHRKRLLIAGAVFCTGSIWAGIDDASRYSTGTTGATRWMSNGHRGDVEFGFWSFEAVAEPWAAAGRFIGSSTAGAGDINTGGQSFGLYANPNGSPNPYAAAIRKFAKPALSTGDIFSFKLTVNNRSPGNRGFDLRNASGTGVFNFDVRSGGYYVNGDGGASLNASHNANTVFTFTFTQRERRVDYTIQRTGGITASASGSFNAASGTIADVRFYISGASSGDASNLYFNQFSLTTETRGDLPLTIGERRTPGVVPSYLLRFTDSNATSVTMRHGGDNFSNSYVLSKGGDNVWSINISNVLTTPGGQKLQPGWHKFKFRPNSAFEAGDDRWMYLDSQGRIAAPPAVYLTWQRDPTTTMTVHWHNFTTAQNTLRYRLEGSAAAWTTLTAATTNAPVGERLVRTAEITGLSAGTMYEFEVDGYTETFRFRTMPANLTQPVKFAVAGDADIGPDADAMAAAIAARDPAFLVMAGDHAYEDSRAETFWKWERYLQSYFTHLRAPDGRLIPIVAAIGNHEIYNGWGEFHPDYENTADWRLRYGMYFFRYFAFPGAAQPYGVLDFGNYLSLVIMDTEHSSPIITGSDAQSLWLAQKLNERRSVPHLLPIYHVPAYPSVRALADPIPARIRTHWVPLLESAGVQLAFENHDHAYKRTKPILNGVSGVADGIVFAGDGAWGVELRTPDATRSYLHGTQARHHAFLLTISNTGRTIEAVDKAGVVFDSFSQGIDGLPAAPAPAISFMATNAFTLAWSNVPRASKYKVIRSDGAQAEVTGTSYTDSGWTPAAAYTYVIEAINRSGHSTNHPTVAAAPKRLWALSQNLPWNVDMTADQDGDGVPNLLEYFHGLNPQVRDMGVPFTVHEVTTSNLAVRYRVNSSATDVSGTPEWTPNLAANTWTNAGVTTNNLTGEWAGWRSATIPVTNGMSAGFMRVRITE